MSKLYPPKLLIDMLTIKLDLVQPPKVDRESIHMDNSREVYFEMRREAIKKKKKIGFIGSGISMFPLIRSNEEVIVREINSESLKIGDIICFWSNPHKRLVGHRLVTIKKEDNRTFFVTKGDNSRVMFDQPIESHQIIGKVVQVGDLEIDTKMWGILNKIIAYFLRIEGIVHERPNRGIRSVFRIIKEITLILFNGKEINRKF